MKAVIQRVRDASVTVDGRVTGAIARGLLVYLGVAAGDGEADAARLAEKAAFLRIFQDADGRMNLSVRDTGGSALVVSQFTLLADTRKGRRPSYNGAAEPAIADALYRRFMVLLEAQGLHVESGVFGASMDVASVNEGPVTIVLDTAEP